MSAALHGVERDPFSLTANPDGYVETQAIEGVLQDAVTALDAGQVPVIVGPTGLGKTLVLQLLARARAERSRPIYIPFCTLGPDELATLALGLLEREGGQDPEIQLLEESRRVAEGGQSLLLLVDDAAALPGETAAQLAHWLNASGGALQMVLAGLPGPALRHARDAFGDRATELTLAEGLEPGEIPTYVQSRLESAAAPPEVRAAFGDSALAELARVSEGNPRRLNLAAQAIVRNAHSEAMAPVANAEGVEIPTTASDLLNVGEYRFVRGRFVDPDTGETMTVEEEVPNVEQTAVPPETAPSSDEPYEPYALEHAPEAEDEAEPEGEREPEREPEPAYEPPPAYTPAPPPPTDRSAPALLEPEIDPPPAGAFDAFNREQAPEDRIQPPRDTQMRSPIPLGSAANASARWIAGGAAMLLLAVGLCTLRDDEPASVVAVTDPEPAAEVGEVPAPEPLPVAPTPGETAETAPPPEEIAAVEPPAVEPTPTPEPVPAPPVAAPVPEPAPPPPAPVVPEPEPTPEPETVAVAEPEPAPPVEPEPTPPPPPPVVPEVAPPPAATVPVAINATPWAIIEVDGKEIGETPLAGIQLTVGRHLFKARMPDGKIQERAVRIDANNATVVFE